MEIFISINFKFYEKTPNELLYLVEKYDTTKCIKGFEAFIDFNNQNEKKYITDFAFLCLQRGYKLQLHGGYFEPYELNYQYLDYAHKLSQIMGHNINIVNHSFAEETTDESIKRTTMFLGDMLDYINNKNYNIKLSLENLNSVKNLIRLGTNDVEKIISNYEALNFTCDFGHQLVSYEPVGHLSESLKESLINVHIHTFDKKMEDHYSLEKNDIHKQAWAKALNYLKMIKYNGPVVLEYDFYRMGGDLYKEHLEGYIANASIINDYL